MSFTVPSNLFFSIQIKYPPGRAVFLLNYGLHAVSMGSVPGLKKPGKKKRRMEMRGIDPRTSRMLSERSTI
jgi:hypothetical protein